MALGWGWRIYVAAFLAGFVPALLAAQAATATPLPGKRDATSSKSKPAAPAKAPTAPLRTKTGDANDVQATAAATATASTPCTPGTRTSAYRVLSTFRDCVDTPEMVRLPGESECVKDEVYRVKDYDGVSGRFSIDAEGAARKPFVLKTVVKGKFVRLSESVVGR